MNPLELLLGVWVGVPALVWLVALAATVRTILSVPLLRNVVVDQTRTAWPTLSVISPACNEAQGIEASLRSLLQQDWPALQLVAINDRSTDDTGAIMDRVAQQDPRLTAVHITQLPDGWLGKLHALHQGTQHARGDWLLFADADVEFAPGSLKQAITHAEARGLDLLTAIPEIAPMGAAGDAVFNAAGVLLCLGSRLWAVKQRTSSAVAGVGAFILVRRSAFEATPGFEWLRLEVADDVGLGLLMKTHGKRCDVVNGCGALRLAWYASFVDLRDKMQKNFFGILARFSLLRAVAMAAVLTWWSTFPVALLAPGLPVWAAVTTVVGLLALVASAVMYAVWARRPLGPAVVVPLGMVLMVYLLLRSTVVGRRLGGITWRGKLYPTALLKAAQKVKV